MMFGLNNSVMNFVGIHKRKTIIRIIIKTMIPATIASFIPTEEVVADFSGWGVGGFGPGGFGVGGFGPGVGGVGFGPGAGGAQSIYSVEGETSEHDL